MQLSPRTMRPRASQRCATTASSGAWLAPRVVLALGEAAHVRQAHIGSQATRGAIGRVLAAHDIDRGARTTRKLGSGHKRATRLRHGQRHVLAGIESGLDGLQRLGSVELRGYTVNEHAVPPASQRQKPAGASSAGRTSNTLSVMVAHGEDSGSRANPAPQKTPDEDALRPTPLRARWGTNLPADTRHTWVCGRRRSRDRR